MKYKYLSDGRKVVVVGQLNNVESIVQEIFVTEAGDEVPSGERFTTKSLHDTPVKSYKQKEEEKLEASITSLKSEIKKYQREKGLVYETLKGYNDILKSTKKLAENIKEAELDRLVMFMTGTVKYIVVDGYKITPPQSLLDNIISFENSSWSDCGKRYDGVKLLSVLGKSNGDLGYWLHRYSDGSGSYTEVHPYVTYKEAVEHIEKKAIEKIKEDKLSEEEYGVCMTLGISFDAELTELYRNKMRHNIESNINLHRATLAKANDSITELEAKLDLYK